MAVGGEAIYLRDHPDGRGGRAIVCIGLAKCLGTGGFFLAAAAAAAAAAAGAAAAGNLVVALGGMVLLAVAAVSSWPSLSSAMEVPVSALLSSIMTGVARVGGRDVRRKH